MTTALSVKAVNTAQGKDKLKTLALDAMYGPRKPSDEPWAELVYGLACDVEAMIDSVIKEENQI
jgi:hypothetical protein